jgi:hypothetical protein
VRLWEKRRGIEEGRGEERRGEEGFGKNYHVIYLP